MEQLNNNTALAMLQAVASQNQLPKTGKSDGDSDFQKLMDKAASGTGRDKAESAPKAEKTTEAAKKDAPVEKEDSLTRIKKMLEENGNAAAFKPGWPWVCVDMNTGETTAVYNPGEYVTVFTGEGFENIPITDLEPWQQAQLNQLLIDPNPIDVSDPRADAILEATAPGADNSPAAMLEKIADGMTGQAAQTAVEEAKPQDGDDDQAELMDVGQGPQRIFHDVEAAPVKVGEVYETEQTGQADVAQQIDAGLAQALERGESLVRIQLTPENLGNVTVEISQSADGVLRVALSAHSSETRGLLERHAADLQGLLTSRTQQFVEVDVQRQAESQQNQNQQNYDGHNGHAQDGQEHRRQRREHTGSQDFIQQLRLGLIPTDGED